MTSNPITNIILALILGMAWGCQPAQAPDTRHPSTIKMAEALDRIAHDTTNLRNYLYLNAIKAERFKVMLQGIPQGVPLSQRLKYFKEVLFAGDNETCIRETEAFIAAAYPDGVITFSNKAYFDVLALAWLRQGELTNCINNHSSESCIIPIAGGGIHQDQAGSSHAVELYIRILEAFPEDLQSRWLLNVAYMTLGQYPAGVPERWRIPESIFASEHVIKRFPDVAGDLGVDVNELAGGVCLDDFNGDGFNDIFATSYGLTGQARLFLSNGDGSFTEKTEEAGIRGLTGGLNCIHADYDNDGLTDVFILRGAWFGNAGKHPNSLLKNLGGGKFRDVTEEAGLLTFRPTQAGAWADFNQDGWLDLFVGNESSFTSFPSELYLNLGNGTFREVSAQVGMSLVTYVKGAAWGDINRDGLPDLYVSILNGPNRLYVNRGGTDISNWRFEEIAAKAGVTEPDWSFPCVFWDYDQDGWEDIFVSGYSTERYDHIAEDVMADFLGLPHQAELPRLYRNLGNETFEEVSARVHLNKVLYTMGMNIGDLDQDGWLDLYCGTGAPDLYSIVPNRMFRNAGGQVFQDVTTAGGFGQIQKGHGIAWADLDNDGDEDIYHVVGGALEGDIYRNMLLANPGTGHNWITLKLEGTTSNRSAIGAKIHVEAVGADGKVRHLYRTVSTGGSFGSNSLEQEIGLGTAVAVQKIVVQWPAKPSKESVWTNVALNQFYLAREGSPALTSLVRPQAPFKVGGGHMHTHVHAGH
ncbi:MAG: CRTAC1 family protein [Bacteroidia bacterium]|nr:CRTAC1 family protein [Bacteroidia bacterium]